MTAFSQSTVEHIAKETSEFVERLIQAGIEASEIGLEAIMGKEDDAVCYRANESGLPIVLKFLRAAAASKGVAGRTFREFFDERLIQDGDLIFILLPTCNTVMASYSIKFMQMLEALDIEYRSEGKIALPQIGLCEKLVVPVQKVRLPLGPLFDILNEF